MVTTKNCLSNRKKKTTQKVAVKSEEGEAAEGAAGHRPRQQNYTKPKLERRNNVSASTRSGNMVISRANDTHIGMDIGVGVGEQPTSGMLLHQLVGIPTRNGQI